MSSSPQNLRSGGFDPEGRRMKHEIIARTRGRIPLSPLQKKWLGHFVPPPRTPQHPDGPYKKRLITRLHARKAKLDHLAAMRHAPRPPGVPPPIVVGQATAALDSRPAREKTRREEEQRTKREAERQEAARARKASLDHLAALRHAPRRAGVPPPIFHEGKSD